jgi:hypothetical protein
MHKSDERKVSSQTNYNFSGRFRVVLTGWFGQVRISSNRFSKIAKRVNLEPNFRFGSSGRQNLEPELEFGSERFRFEPGS